MASLLVLQGHVCLLKTHYVQTLCYFPGRNHVQDLQIFKQDSCMENVPFLVSFLQVTCSFATDFSLGCVDFVH